MHVEQRTGRTILIGRHLQTPRTEGRRKLLSDPAYIEMTRLSSIAIQYGIGSLTIQERVKMIGLANTLCTNEQYKITTPDSQLPLAMGQEHIGKRLGEQITSTYGRVHEVRISPFLRTRQTVDLITQDNPDFKGSHRVIDSRLKEQSLGDAAGCPKGSIYRSRDLRQLAKFIKKGSRAWRAPHGESQKDVRKRVQRIVQELNRKKYKGKTVLLITSNQPMVEFMGVLGRLSEEQLIELNQQDRLEPGAIAVFKEVVDGRRKWWSRRRYTLAFEQDSVNQIQ